MNIIKVDTCTAYHWKGMVKNYKICITYFNISLVLHQKSIVRSGNIVPVSNSKSVNSSGLSLICILSFSETKMIIVD